MEQRNGLTPCWAAFHPALKGCGALPRSEGEEHDQQGAWRMHHVLAFLVAASHSTLHTGSTWLTVLQEKRWDRRG